MFVGILMGSSPVIRISFAFLIIVHPLSTCCSIILSPFLSILFLFICDFYTQFANASKSHDDNDDDYDDNNKDKGII